MTLLPRFKIGVDVGERNIFYFSNGYKYRYPVHLKHNSEDNRKDFQDWMEIRFPLINRYIFVMESYLIERLLEYRLNMTPKQKRYIDKVNEFIQYFLENYKKQIVFVESRDSSIECHRCGDISHGNRANLQGHRSSNEFWCLVCNHRVQSDLNAALVLVNRYERNA